MENIQDSNVVSFGLIVQEMRNEITNLIKAIIKQARSKPMRISNYVSLLILFRMKECMASVEILISKGLERDAATLILTLIELRLDMQYIVIKYKNAETWINHSKEYRKPWKVGFLFDELFPNENERKSEREIYRIFSMIKHGNPFGGTISFPVGVNDEWLVVNEKTSDSNKRAIYVFAEGIQCYGIFKATIKDFSEAGFDIKSNEIAIESLNSKLIERNYEHSISMLISILSNTK